MADISVQDQYKIGLELENGNGDFFEVNAYTLDRLTIAENATGTLPTFQIKFTTAVDEVPSLLHEGSPLIITETLSASKFTSGKELTSKASFLPLHPLIQRTSTGLFDITATGALNAPEYQHSAKTKVWGLAGGVKVARNLLAESFELDSLSLTDSDDKMNYIQPNISDMDMVRQALKHSWIRGGEGWVAHALTAEGKDGKKTTARVYDMDLIIQKAKAGQTYWKFTNLQEGFQSAGRAGKGQNVDIKNGVPINYNENYVFSNDSSMMNIIAGYSRKDLAYNMESQGVETQKALLASKKLTDNPNFLRNMRMAGDTGPSPRFSLIGDNVHPQFNIAAYTNLGNRALFSSSKFVLTFDGEFYPIRPLDTAFLEVAALKNPEQINPSLSGAYIVSEVVREYANQKTSSTITLTRDGPQAAQGSLS